MDLVFGSTSGELIINGKNILNEDDSSVIPL